MVRENKEGKLSLFAAFARAVGKCNQVIYEEVIVALCCQPEREVFNDISTVHSNSKASEIVRDDMTRANDSNSKIFETGRDDMTCANGAFSPLNNDVDKTSLGAMRGHTKVAFTLTNDDSPREVTKARRSRSMQKSRSLGGSSRSMRRGRDKISTRADSTKLSSSSRMRHPLRNSTRYSSRTPTRTMIDLKKLPNRSKVRHPPRTSEKYPQRDPTRRPQRTPTRTMIDFTKWSSLSRMRHPARHPRETRRETRRDTRRGRC